MAISLKFQEKSAPEKTPVEKQPPESVLNKKIPKRAQRAIIKAAAQMAVEEELNTYLMFDSAEEKLAITSNENILRILQKLFSVGIQETEDEANALLIRSSSKKDKNNPGRTQNIFKLIQSILTKSLEMLQKEEIVAPQFLVDEVKSIASKGKGIIETRLQQNITKFTSYSVGLPLSNEHTKLFFEENLKLFDRLQKDFGFNFSQSKTNIDIQDPLLRFDLESFKPITKKILNLANLPKNKLPVTDQEIYDFIYIEPVIDPSQIIRYGHKEEEKPLPLINSFDVSNVQVHQKIELRGKKQQNDGYVNLLEFSRIYPNLIVQENEEGNAFEIFSKNDPNGIDVSNAALIITTLEKLKLIYADKKTSSSQIREITEDIVRLTLDKVRNNDNVYFEHIEKLKTLEEIYAFNFGINKKTATPAQNIKEQKDYNVNDKPFKKTDVKDIIDRISLNITDQSGHQGNLFSSSSPRIAEKLLAPNIIQIVKDSLDVKLKINPKDDSEIVIIGEVEQQKYAHAFLDLAQNVILETEKDIKRGVLKQIDLHVTEKPTFLSAEEIGYGSNTPFDDIVKFLKKPRIAWQDKKKEIKQQDEELQLLNAEFMRFKQNIKNTSSNDRFNANDVLPIYEQFYDRLEEIAEQKIDVAKEKSKNKKISEEQIALIKQQPDFIRIAAIREILDEKHAYGLRKIQDQAARNLRNLDEAKSPFNKSEQNDITGLIKSELQNNGKSLGLTKLNALMTVMFNEIDQSTIDNRGMQLIMAKAYTPLKQSKTVKQTTETAKQATKAISFPIAEPLHVQGIIYNDPNRMVRTYFDRQLRKNCIEITERSSLFKQELKLKDLFTPELSEAINKKNNAPARQKAENIVTSFVRNKSEENEKGYNSPEAQVGTTIKIALDSKLMPDNRFVQLRYSIGTVNSSMKQLTPRQWEEQFSNPDECSTEINTLQNIAYANSNKRTPKNSLTMNDTMEVIHNLFESCVAEYVLKQYKEEKPLPIPLHVTLRTPSLEQILQEQEEKRQEAKRHKPLLVTIEPKTKPRKFDTQKFYINASELGAYSKLPKDSTAKYCTNIGGDDIPGILGHYLLSLHLQQPDRKILSAEQGEILKKLFNFTEKVKAPHVAPIYQ